MRKTEYLEKDGGVSFISTEFDPGMIFDCGQCFRFDPVGDFWEGVACGKRIRVHAKDSLVSVSPCTGKEFEDIWYDFFDLEHDYKKIGEDIIAHSGEYAPVMKKAIETGRGIRILKQDGWEALISFIISQNNNIPRIKKLISVLSEETGSERFPTPEEILMLGEERLKELKFGFRAGYIIDAAEKVASGSIVLSKIEKMSFDEALEYLTRIKGVGVKVASCTLLFGFGKLSAFPIDVWIKKVIDKYFDGVLPDFGEYAGVAQQYLFYNERYVQNKS